MQCYYLNVQIYADTLIYIAKRLVVVVVSSVQVINHAHSKLALVGVPAGLYTKSYVTIHIWRTP